VETRPTSVGIARHTWWSPSNRALSPSGLPALPYLVRLPLVDWPHSSMRLASIYLGSRALVRGAFSSPAMLRLGPRRRRLELW
jgi:hypothetical protein